MSHESQHALVPLKLLTGEGILALQLDSEEGLCNSDVEMASVVLCNANNNCELPARLLRACGQQHYGLAGGNLVAGCGVHSHITAGGKQT